MDPLPTIASALSRARSIVVLTGAGISAESGIPTFRQTMDALWKEFDPAKLATPEAFARDPETVTRWYDKRRLGCLAAQPNPGHLALAELERRLRDDLRAAGFSPRGTPSSPGRCFTLLTQNVDRLHQRAGSRNVVELHGSIIEWRCTRTGARTTPPPEPFTDYPPRSTAGHPLRPDVVWFGEMLPEAALAASFAALDSCDVFLSVGTSSVVYPAAGFIDIAKHRGAMTVEINREPTPISARVDHALHGPAGEILPQLLA